MKNVIFAIVILFWSTCFAQAQGSIVGLTTSPTNPTSTDSITFYVDVSFTSVGCDLDQSGISVNGLTVMASALHCVGMLAVICNTVDTFKIGPQPAGTYTLDMTLSSGAGPAPCSPGIVPDDHRMFQFTVSTATDVVSIKGSSLLRVYPNPVKEYALFEFEEAPEQLFLYNTLGQLIVAPILTDKNYRLNTEQLAKGVYYYNVKTKKGKISGKLILE